MKNFLTVLCYIFTFGIFYLVVKNKAKKRIQNTNQQLFCTNEIPFKLNNFINALGGLENIITASANISNIKIVLQDKNKCDVRLLNKLSPRGIMFTSNSVTCLLGDFSSSLANELVEKVKKN